MNHAPQATARLLCTLLAASFIAPVKGQTEPADRAGVIRLGAASRHKYVLGYCSNCRWIRWIRLAKDLDRTNLTDQLGVATTPAELRSEAHRPWLTVFCILLTVAIILGVVFGLQELLQWAVGF